MFYPAPTPHPTRFEKIEDMDTRIVDLYNMTVNSSFNTNAFQRMSENVLGSGGELGSLAYSELHNAPNNQFITLVELGGSGNLCAVFTHGLNGFGADVRITRDGETHTFNVPTRTSSQLAGMIGTMPLQSGSNRTAMFSISEFDLRQVGLPFEHHLKVEIMKKGDTALKSSGSFIHAARCYYARNKEF